MEISSGNEVYAVTTTEDLPALQPIIITKQCSHSWLAWVDDDRLINTESGLTEAEAIGKVHMMHPELFGPVQRMGDSRG